MRRRARREIRKTPVRGCRIQLRRDRQEAKSAKKCECIEFPGGLGVLATWRRSCVACFSAISPTTPEKTESSRVGMCRETAAAHCVDWVDDAFAMRLFGGRVFPHSQPSVRKVMDCVTSRWEQYFRAASPGLPPSANRRKSLRVRASGWGVSRRSAFGKSSVVND
jgi:hypothetical protein